MDEDLYHTLKKEEYLKLIQPVLKKFKKLVTKANNYVKGSSYSLHSVEIVGGGIRIPVVREII